MGTKELTFKDIMSFSFENEEVFEELTSFCINGKIVPYIGSGLSYFADFPTWSEFINPLYKDCFGVDKPNSMDFIVAADEIEQKLGKEEFSNRIYITMGGNTTYAEWEDILKKAKTQAISIIPKLFFGTIVTTNFDQIIEHIYKDIPDFDIAFPNHLGKIEQIIQKRKRLLYKIHGCVSDIENVIFTKTKYNEEYYSSSNLVKSLSILFQGYNFLFLGCGLEITIGTIDEPIKLWIDLKSDKHHFAILPCNKSNLKDRRSELERQNIYPIFYNSEADIKHESVRIIINKLLKEYENRLFKIPSYDLRYIEREDSVVQKIKDKLDDAKFSVCAITGLGGIGKTRIMSEYARETEKTSTKVFWFNAISADYIKEEIRQFTLEKRLITKTEKDAYYIFQVFKNWMIENENWLFLLDNVEYYEDIRIFLDIDNTLMGKRHILLTSRNEESKIHNIKTIELDVFNKKESLIFLEEHTNKKSDEYAEEMAKCLGRLPLALEQAASYVREEDESYKNYFELLENDTISSLEKKCLSHTESVGATWNISMQRIAEEAQQMLYLCSYMASENIDEMLFENSKLLPLPLKEKFTDHLNRNAIWSQLTRYSLLKKQGNLQSYSMHILLQEVVRNKINSELQWAQCCLSLFYKSYDFKYGDAKKHNCFLRLTPHVEAFLNAAKYVITIDKEQEKIAYLYHMGGSGNRQLGNYNRALKWYCNAQAIYEKVLGKEHPFTATIYNDMAVIFQDRGNYDKALEYYGYALTIREKVLGKEHPDTATTYDNMAATFKDQGDYGRALEYYGYALIIRKEVLGKEHSDTAITYNNMALVFQDQGNYKKALEYCGYALIIFEKALGKEHPNTATTYNNMAETFRIQGNYTEALKYCRSALAIFEKVLGKKHPDTATIYNNIALVFHAQGNYVKASEYYGYALTIYEKTFGKEHPNTASTYNNIAEVFRAQGDNTNALKYYSLALAICEVFLGKWHLDTATIYNNIALVFQANGEYTKALEWYVKAFRIFLNKLGVEHQNTKKVRKNIAQAYRLSCNTMNFEKWLEEQTLLSN
jgi:tetratricopeptide (TPR) repeat protein